MNPVLARYMLTTGRNKVKTLADDGIAESQLLSDVRAIVKDYNIVNVRRPLLLIYHTHRSDHSEAGYPDLHIVSEADSLYRELKADGKHPEPAQAEWLDMLERQGRNVGVWRPEDMASGRIHREILELVAAGQRWRRTKGKLWTRSWS